MPIQPIRVLSEVVSHEELCDVVARFQKYVNFLQSKNIDSENAREIGGWEIDTDKLSAIDGDVGLYTGDDVADPVRLWAGSVSKDSAPWRVHKSGKMYATGAVIQSTATGERIVIDPTGFHSYDAGGIERITIGTAPVKGVKAIVFRNIAGVEQAVATFDTETVDGALRTGQYYTCGGSYILIEPNGDIRIQRGTSTLSEGLRIRSFSRPEMNDGNGWATIAKQSDLTSKATTGVNTSSHTQPDHNHAISPGRYLMTYDSAGNQLGLQQWVASGGFSHSHTQT